MLYRTELVTVILPESVHYIVRYRVVNCTTNAFLLVVNDKDFSDGGWRDPIHLAGP